MGSPRIDAIESAVTGLGVSLRTPVVNLTYRTATTATGTPSAGLFHSTIIGRSKMTDLSNDLLPRFGIDRIVVQAMQEVQNEFGPNGERVFKPINDQHDAIRFVGSIGQQNDYSGQLVGVTLNSYSEITFYGTGLNILCYGDGTNRAMQVYVDGVLSSTVNNQVSPAINQRSYSPNLVFNLVSGLTLGVHTVRIVSTTATVYTLGYEVLNTNSTLQYTPGSSTVNGKLLTASSLTTSSYSANFESGTLGTKGGCVLVYQKSDGTIAKALTPTRSSAATYLSSISAADRADEEVVRTYYWREFGCGRHTANAGQAFDDFSTVTTATTDRYFTLDDNVTGLNCNDVQARSTNDALNIVSNSTGFAVFTFVGTGLDVVWSGDGTGTQTNANAYEVFIDGVSVGNWTQTATTDLKVVQKICSGLQYGTHVVRIQRNVPNIFTVGIHQLVVYAPKTPTLPSGAVALGQYYLMGDYSPNTTVAHDRIGQGLLRKASLREWVYTGTWSAINVLTAPTGQAVQGTTNGGTASSIFLGSGFDLRFNGATTYSISVLNILTNTTITNFSGYTVSVYGNSFTAASGTGTANASDGCGLNISGLGFGLYKVTLTCTGVAGININSMDVITPVHAPAFNGPGVLQNVLSVGSCAIMDKRSFDAKQIPTIKPWTQAIGISGNPTLSSPAATYIPVPDMSCTIKTSGNPIVVSFAGNMSNSVNSYTSSALIFINGVIQPPGSSKYLQTGGATFESNLQRVFQVPAGTHKIDVYWWNENVGMTVTAVSANRTLTVREL
jgi:hypothetical protein